jgi:hypothetical protein
VATVTPLGAVVTEDPLGLLVTVVPLLRVTVAPLGAVTWKSSPSEGLMAATALVTEVETPLAMR